MAVQVHNIELIQDVNVNEAKNLERKCTVASKRLIFVGLHELR